MTTPDIGNPFYYWASGIVVGFHLREKLPRWLQKVLRVLAVLSLLGAAGYMARNLASVGLGSPPPTRLLTQVETKPLTTTATPVTLPPVEVLKRLHKESADREREGKVSVRDLQKAAQREILRNEAEREEAINKHLWPKSKADVDAQIAYAMASGTVMVTTASGGTLFVSASSSVSSPGQPIGTRKGPFCRVTCMVHHGSAYDVETDKEFCDKNQIPPDATEVPGWATQGNMEYRQPWPGPGGGGFDSYRLYWQK